MSRDVSQCDVKRAALSVRANRSPRGGWFHCTDAFGRTNDPTSEARSLYVAVRSRSRRTTGYQTFP